MIPWVQIYSNLPQHRKTSKLAEELKISSAAVDPNVVAVGILIGLWTWAIQNAYDGDLKDCSARTIANACQWKKKPETLVQALMKTGWIDEDMQLHDWKEYALLVIDQEENRKQKTRERVNRYRRKKSDECNATKSVTCNITDTQCNASTKPNHTRPVPSPPVSPPSGGGPDFAPKLQAAFESWLRYKQEKRQGYKPEGLKALVGQIRNAAEQYGEDAVVELINTSMSSNWQGIAFDRLRKQSAQPAKRRTGREANGTAGDYEAAALARMLEMEGG